MPWPTGAFTGRRDEVARLAKAGLTLQQIGDRFGVTRERARQVLAKMGITRSERGISIRAVANAEVRAEKKRQQTDARYLKYYGCSFAHAVMLNEGNPVSLKNSFARRYVYQKKNARFRGIDWEISFPQWMRVWRESGHLHERGRGHGKYVMSRFGDAGPYKIGNVFIQLADQNNSEGTKAAFARGCYNKAA